MEKQLLEAIAKLNDEQRRAVETINGPVLVIAGPGTGKTELLALRAAEILRKDSTMLPSNILFLTFTNAAANNMRERLVKYIGQDAYQIAIHTFNSFGSYVMAAYPEFFYEWREVQIADEITTHNVLEKILSELPGNHPLAARAPGGAFFALTRIRNLIGDAKRADLNPMQLQTLLGENAKTFETLRPLIRKYWPDRITDKEALVNIAKLGNEIDLIKTPRSRVEAIQPIHKSIVESLKRAAVESEALEKGKTKPFTAWKQQWLVKDEGRDWIFSGEVHQETLKAAADIYHLYQKRMDRDGLADFNDQIMQVIAAIESNDELHYNLQERFNYIMIDEFQDTNRSQLLFASYLTDAPVHEGRPNILAVGDDDQAIFRFQGADIANVSLFESLYQEPELISLTTNYRSHKEILDASRHISRQISVSLQKEKNINKDLQTTVKKRSTGVCLNEYDYESQHYSDISKTIKQQLDQGVPGREIAVLARERAQLDALVPYMREQNIPINYERRENVLQQRHIVNLLDMIKLVYLIEQNRQKEANEQFASVLSQNMWQIEAMELWQLAAEAKEQDRLWFDILKSQPQNKCRKIADFFIKLGYASKTMPLEQVLDELIGIETSEDPKPFSPFKRYYFSEEILAEEPSEYLTLLSHLSTLRRHLHNYQSNIQQTLYVSDLVQLVDLYEHANMTMLDHSPHNEAADAVQFMTVHNSKGLEFDSVYVIGLQHDVWTRATTRSRFSYPMNLKVIRPSDNQDDDSLRLLFVSMTRAKQNLQLNYFKTTEDGSTSQVFAPLLAIGHTANRPTVAVDKPALARQFEHRWLAPISGVGRADMQAFFSDKLANYRLSATHLNNFLDVSIGGPLYYFNRNLVQFPQAQSPASIYGSLIHASLRRTHLDVIAGRGINIDKMIKSYIDDLEQQPLSERDKQRYAHQGRGVLSNFLKKHRDNFKPHQVVECNFKSQHVSIGDARLTGLVDLIDRDKQEKTATITEYKTGRGYANWKPSAKTIELRKVKLYNYRRQLLFYKLLLDNAREWGMRGWHVDNGYLCFVEPEGGKIRSLEIKYEAEEIASLKKLIQVVWSRVQNLNFPDTSKYPPSLEGIKAFEKDLLETG